MSKQRCAHINADLTMCQQIRLHEDSIYCKKHFADVYGGSRSSNIQDNRYDLIKRTVKQLRNDQGYSI